MARLILAGIVELLGLGVIVWGIALFCVPAAVIVGGLALVAVGLAIDPPARRVQLKEGEIKQ